MAAKLDVLTILTKDGTLTIDQDFKSIFKFSIGDECVRTPSLTLSQPRTSR